MRLIRANATTWINLDCVAQIVDNGDGTAAVSIVGVAVPLTVPLATIRALFAEWRTSAPILPPQPPKDNGV